MFASSMLRLLTVVSFTFLNVWAFSGSAAIVTWNETSLVSSVILQNNEANDESAVNLILDQQVLWDFVLDDASCTNGTVNDYRWNQTDSEFISNSLISLPKWQLYRSTPSAVQCVTRLGMTLSSLKDSSSHSMTTTTVDSSGLVSDAPVPSNDSPSRVVSSTADIWKDETHEMNGISLELWLQLSSWASWSTASSAVNSTNNGFAPIVTIGRLGLANSTAPSFPALNHCDQHDLDFQILQQGSWIHVFYRTSDVYLEPCQLYRLELPPANDRAMHHVLISLGHEHQQVFWDGVLKVTLNRPFQADLSHWMSAPLTQAAATTVTPPTGLFLFDYFQGNDPLNVPVLPWNGTLFRVRAFSAALNVTMVRNYLLGGGLPQSAPFGIPATVRINEDAEPVAGSHDPAWYETSPSPQTAAPLTLPIGSVDAQVEALWNQTGVVPRRFVGAPIYVYIVSLPKHGSLFLMDGRRVGIPTLHPGNRTTSLPSTMTEVVSNDSNTFQIVYIPPLNAYSKSTDSAYDGFDFCVSPRRLRKVSDCESTARLQIVVEPVNDPPVPRQIPNVVVFEGPEKLGRQPNMLLTGTDVDDNDYIGSVEITQLPSMGHLVLAVNQFRNDGLLHGTPLSSLGNMLSTGPGVNDNPVSVKYLLDPKVATVVPVNDSFRFRLADGSGRWSREQTVRITVAAAVHGTVRPASASVFRTNETTAKQVWLRGVEESGYNRSIRFQAVSLPPQEIASVTVASNGQLLRSGDFVLGTFSSGSEIQIEILPASEFCLHRNLSSGSLAQNASIDLRVVALGGYNGSKIVSLSDPFRHVLLFDCPVDGVRLDGPSEKLTVQQVSLHTLASSACGNLTSDANSSLELLCQRDPYLLRITDFVLESTNQEVESVAVILAVEYGLLSFADEAAWNATVVYEGRQHTSSARVVLMAHPDIISETLSGLQYQSYVSGPDSITVHVLYGACDWMGFRQSLWTIEDLGECQVLSHVVEISVVAAADAMETRLFRASFAPMIVCLFGYPLLYLFWIRIERWWKLRKQAPKREEQEL
jgi:hypothetical protein